MHDFRHLFARICRALGWSAPLLAATCLLLPAKIIPGNRVSHALLSLLVAVPAIMSLRFDFRILCDTVKFVPSGRRPG